MYNRQFIEARALRALPIGRDIYQLGIYIFRDLLYLLETSRVRYEKPFFLTKLNTSGLEV